MHICARGHLTMNSMISSSNAIARQYRTSRMFNGSFQHKIILRFMDAFLNEGFKIIYRVTLGLFKLHSSALLKYTLPLLSIMHLVVSVFINMTRFRFVIICYRTKTAPQFLETLTKLINGTDPSALMKTGIIFHSFEHCDLCYI
jgi:hypothetical protein